MKTEKHQMYKVFLNRLPMLLLPLSAVLMEVFWGYPWFIWIGKWETLHWQKPPLNIFSILSLVVISFLTTRFLLNRSWSSRAIKITIAGLGLLVVLIVMRIEYGNGIELLSTGWFVYIGKIILNSFSNLNSIVFAFPAAAYFWWRGMLLGRAREYNYIRSNVVYGAGSYVVLGMVWWITMGAITFRDMANAIGPYIAAFFFFGLVGTAFNNLRNVQKRMPQEETQTISYGRWLPLVVGIVTVIVAVGSIVATATTLDIAGNIKRFFSMFSGFIETVLTWLAIPMEYIFMPFEWIARNLIELLVRLLGVKPIQQDGEMGSGEIPEIVPGTTPEDWLTVIKWSLFIIVVIVVTILIARSIEKNRRHRNETNPSLDETHESLWSWRMFFANLILFFKRLFGRFLPKKIVKGIASLGGVITSQTEPSVTTLKIREVFKHLLRDASKSGIGRQCFETPLEYAHRFTEEVPETAASMQELTELYVLVRYSDSEASAIHVTRANSLWHQIRERLKRFRTENN
jgi:hypothetical protein